MPRHRLDLIRRHDQHHADAHVEDAQHLLGVDVAVLVQVAEDRQHRPRAELDLRVERLRKHARHVVGEAAAGDVRERVQGALLDERQQRFQI